MHGSGIRKLSAPSAPHSAQGPRSTRSCGQAGRCRPVRRSPTGTRPKRSRPKPRVARRVPGTPLTPPVVAPRAPNASAPPADPRSYPAGHCQAWPADPPLGAQGWGVDPTPPDTGWSPAAKSSSDPATTRRHSSMCRLAGHFNGTDPTVPVAELKQLWVPGIRIVYIGKANHGGSRKGGLLKRLDEFPRFGASEPVCHLILRPVLTGMDQCAGPIRRDRRLSCGGWRRQHRHRPGGGRQTVSHRWRD